MEKKYPELPEYIKKKLQSGEEIDELRIDAEGRWLHNGVPFRNKKIISFFNKSIGITKERMYVIHYNDFIYPVVVEDAPLFVTGLRFDNSESNEEVFIALTSGETEKLNPDTLHFKNNSLYCFVRDNEIAAKFRRSPSYEMLQYIKETDDIYYLEICGKKIVLAEKMDFE